MPDSLEIVALQELGLALAPLGRLTTARRVTEFVRQLGWELPGQDLLTVDMSALLALPARIAALQAAASGDERLVAAADLLAAIGDAVQQITDVVGNVETAYAAFGPFLQLSGIREQFPRRTLDFMVASYLSGRHRAAHAVMALVGLVESEEKIADPATFQSAHTRRVIRWDRFPTLLRDPGQLAVDVYGWGTPGFLAATLLERLTGLMQAFGIAAGLYRVPPAIAAALGTSDNPAERELRVPLFAGGTWEVDYSELGLALARARDGANPPGLAVLPYMVGGAATTWPLGSAWQLAFEVSLALEGGVAAVLLPGKGARLDVGFLSGAPASADGQIRLALEPSATRPADSEILLFGAAGGTRLAARDVVVEALAKVAGGAGEVRARTAVGGGRVVIDGSNYDGFLGSVFPKQPFEIPFDVEITWSSRTGFHFSGALGLALTLPVHVSILGVLDVETVDLEAKVAPGDGALEASVATTVGVKIGPVAATVAKLGLRADLRITPDGSGNLSVVDAQLGFKPPNGAALSIEAGTVTGGGFLFFDPDKAQYAGGLHLEFENLVLNAIGLLTTRMPDGSKGFSLIVIVQASGFAPIPLGFGFSLQGVGGLLGINRTVALDVLRAGVRDRTLDAILFSSDDPTPRAPQILSTLQAVFPPAANRYVFGPMAVIGWGAPVTLVTIELALLLELPAPMRLVVLGRARAALPDPDHPIVSIHLDVVGIVDFDKSALSVDATLYDSMIGPYALTGDMAARANWGDNPDFAMALGGFHPAFKPPPGFPALRRLALALSTGDNPRLRMETYLALTSNTVQIGARAELYVAAGGFALEGALGFDTLIQFSPFRLLVEIGAHLALKRGGRTLMGLDVHVNIAGPAPWVLWGEVRFKILFVRFSVSFRATFGRAEPVPAIERRDVWPVLRDSLAADGNWSSALPPDTGRLVVLRDETGELLAHPLGTLTVSQNLVPLERTLGLFGSTPPKDYDRFEIAGAAGLQFVAPAMQYFAPAQFRRMSDAEKLASPSFERMVSGVRLAPRAAVAFGHVQETPLDYEQSVILDVDQPAAERLDQRYAPSGESVAALAEHGPAGTAELREQGRARFAPRAKGPAVAEPRYVVVTRDDLNVVPLDRLDGSYTSAAEGMRRRADRAELQIVRAEELAA